MNIHNNHAPYFVAALENQWPACIHGIDGRRTINGLSCVNMVLRWMLQRIENGVRTKIIYVYTNDMKELDTISAKHGTPVANLRGYRHLCTNTIEQSDLCDYSDPKQYMPWRSHNQPHG